MITLKQFNQLAPNEQLTTVWENGLYLVSRQEADSSELNIYQVGSFFVEICFYSLNNFRLVRAFEDTRLLIPYLDKVILKNLYE